LLYNTKLRTSKKGPENLAKSANSLSEKVYSTLRQEIINGGFSKEEPLRLAQLQERYGIGFSPIREALTRLTADGLVVSESMRGFRVAPLSIADLRDTMDIRILVETEAFRRSIENGSDEWETKIVSTLHAFKRQLGRSKHNDPESLDQLEVRHREFHFALIAASESQRLQTIIENLYLGSARYRVLKPTEHAKLPARDLEGEHSAIAEAALDRNSELAVTLLREHYARSADVLEKAHQSLAIGD
jgi:DNA-binding GntR family transcriptional regulator